MLGEQLWGDIVGSGLRAGETILKKQFPRWCLGTTTFTDDTVLTCAGDVAEYFELRKLTSWYEEVWQMYPNTDYGAKI